MGNCSSANTHPALPAIDLGNGVRIDTPVLLAPMSGVTDLPFRRTAKELGAGMVVSEMIASWAMVRENRKTLDMAEVDGCGGVSALQLAGCDPDGDGRGGPARGGPRRRPDRHQLRLPGEEGRGRPGRRLRADARRDRRRRDPGSHRQGRPGPGDAEDAHGLGPRQPERASAGAHRAGLRHPHGHRARPHPAAVLQRHRRLGLHPPGEGRRRASR